MLDQTVPSKCEKTSIRRQISVQNLLIDAALPLFETTLALVQPNEKARNGLLNIGVLKGCPLLYIL